MFSRVRRRQFTRRCSRTVGGRRCYSRKVFRPVIHRTSTSLEALLQVPLLAPRRPRGDSPRFDATMTIFGEIQAFKLKLMRLKVAKTSKNITSMTRLTRQNRMKERLTSTSDEIWQRKQSLCNTNFSTRQRTHIAPCA